MLCEENVEKTHDFNEREAMYAIMYAAASRGKGKKGKLPSLSDLYKRPTSEDMAKIRSENLIEKQQEAERWISQFDLSKLTSREGE